MSHLTETNIYWLCPIKDSPAEIFLHGLLKFHCRGGGVIVRVHHEMIICRVKIKYLYVNEHL